MKTAPGGWRGGFAIHSAPQQIKTFKLKRAFLCANNIHSCQLMEQNQLNGSIFLLLMDKKAGRWTQHLIRCNYINRTTQINVSIRPAAQRCWPFAYRLDIISNHSFTELFKRQWEHSLTEAFFLVVTDDFFEAKSKIMTTVQKKNTASTLFCILFFNYLKKAVLPANPCLLTW